MYSLRRITPDQLTLEISSTIAKLDKTIFPEDHSIRFKECYFWLAFKGREPVGYACLNVKYGLAYFERGGVLKSHCGKGLYKRLIRAACAQAKRMKFDSVITYTLLDNVPSINGLTACGFRADNPEFKFVGNRVCYWKKKLKKGTGR